MPTVTGIVYPYSSALGRHRTRISVVSNVLPSFTSSVLVKFSVVLGQNKFIVLYSFTNIDYTGPDKNLKNVD